MKLSLSVRIAEDATKTTLNLPFADIVHIARDQDYDAICLRASAAGVQTPREQRIKMKEEINRCGLVVSMVTTDCDVPLNNENGPKALRDITPSLEVAEDFGCDLIRVCMKNETDIPVAQSACDLAAQKNIRLAHQCHTTTLCEEVEPTLELLKKIDRSNFGLIFEPANLMLCGQSYGMETLKAYFPYVMNVYVQNHRLDANGPVSQETWCRGVQSFHNLLLWEEGGVDIAGLIHNLLSLEYTGYFTIHHAQDVKTTLEAEQYAKNCAKFVRSFLS